MKNPVKFGKYYLLERISVGGMAEVFKAKSFGEAGFERLVAVKRILPSIAEDQEFIAMFVDEAKLAVQLTHPNIAQIFELGKVGDAYFIALEYVAGKDMRAIFDRARKRTEPIPIPMACYIVMKLCEGLDYAHNKKDAAGRSLELVHRDVSPQNILVSYEGDVKLIDFGIAKAASKSSKTQAGILKGKFGYMSPEQVRGLQVDRRSDVFAVGICLYELLTMERLFVGESDFSTLEKVRNVEIMPPSTYNRKVPEELETIVLKALAKHPEDRYRNAMDLHDDLQSFQYTSGNFFARKDLSAYMGGLFSEEIAKEASRDEEYRRFDSHRANDLAVFENAHAPRPAPAPPSPPSSGPRVGAAPPPPPVRSAPPPPPPPRPAQRSTVMGLGGAAVQAAAAPQQRPVAAVPPPMPSSNGAAARAVNLAKPAASAPPSPVASGVQVAAAGAMDMDWDDEELATQVYDKPEGLSASPSPPPMVPAAGNRASGPRLTGSIPVVPALPVVPPIPTGRPSGVAAPPPPSSSLPSAPMPSTSLQPAMSAPAMSAPAVPPPPMPNGSLTPPMPAPGPMSSAGPAPGRPVSAPPPGQPRPSLPPPGLPAGAQRQQADWPAQHTSLITPTKKKNNTSVVVLSLLSVIAIAAAVVIGLKLTRGEPMGALAITTNVGGVTVLVDEQPQIGNGQSFTIQNLATTRVHHVVVRKPGFRTFQQDVPVLEATITPMQVVLEPEAPAQNPLLAVAPSVPVVQQQLPPTMPVAQPAAPVAQPAPTQQVIQQPLPPTVPVVPPPTPVAPVAARPVAPRPRPTPRATPRATPTPAPTPTFVAAPAARPTPAPAPSNDGDGILLLSTRPAAQCRVNGQTVSTPRRLTLPAGTHRITCENSELNARATWSVTIRSGETTRDVMHALDN